MKKKAKSKKRAPRVKIKLDYKVKLLSLAAIALALVLLCASFTVEGAGKYREKTIETLSREQELLVEQVGREARNELKRYAAAAASFSEAEKGVAEGLLQTVETSGSRYWFFYSDKGVIFEKNEEETRNVEGKNLEELVEKWKISGGTETEKFETLVEERKSGSVVFTKNIGTGEEVVSVTHFKVSGRYYHLGMATQKAYLLQESGVNSHLLYLYSFAGVVCVSLVVLTLLLCLTIYRKHTESEQSNRSIIDKTLKIQELTLKLDAKTEAVEVASIYDSLTKMYNRKFFDTFLSKIKSRLLMPVSILVLDINGLFRLNELEGYSLGDDLLIKTAEILRRVCIETDIVCRTDGSEFTIIMTGTKENGAYGVAENILRQFVDLGRSEVSLSYGVAQMHTEEISISSTLAQARKKLFIDKLLDDKSKNRNIIMMLLKTLESYSPQAVGHCRRLRELASAFGKSIGLPVAELAELELAAELHDIGKIGIPDSILNKKEALTEEEKRMVRSHPEIGYRIVKIIPALNHVAEAILQHHESYDGNGYPAGLKGEEVFLNARIIGILDSFDAMTNPSVYAKTKTKEEAIAEIRKMSGKQFDPYIVNEFVKGAENDWFWISELLG